MYRNLLGLFFLDRWRMTNILKYAGHNQTPITCRQSIVDAKVTQFHFQGNSWWPLTGDKNMSEFGKKKYKSMVV